MLSKDNIVICMLLNQFWCIKYHRNIKIDGLCGIFHKHAGRLQPPASYVSVIDTTYMVANNLHTIYLA